MRTRLQHLGQRLGQYLRRDIYYVSDAQQWAFYWVAAYLTEGLNQLPGVRAHMTRSPWELRRQIIHFGDRYAYLLEDGFRRVHPSNQVLLTWFHGAADDPNPNIRALFDTLPQTLPHLEKVVVPCRITWEALAGQWVPPEKLVLIPIGVDLRQFQAPSSAQRQAARQALGIPEGAFCIGSFQKDGQGWGDGAEPKLEKGPDVFLEAIARLAPRLPGLFVLLTGPARDYVRNGLDKIGVAYRHDVLDHYHDIVRHYHALDLYLISSRTEGGPKALLESWACAVPVVSTRMGMPADLIRQGENGLLAEVEDSSGLAAAALQMAEDSALRDHCRQQALQDVPAYDWRKIAQQYYHQLYQPLLAGGR